MANIYAVKSGNWSDTTLWNTNSLPATVDIVYSNNFIVYVDTNTKVSKITNNSASGINRGGYFIINNNISLSAFVEGGGTSNNTGALACLQFLSASPSFGSLYGDLSGRQNDGNIIYPIIFMHNGTGTFNIYGNCLGVAVSGSTTVALGYVCNKNTGTLNISGNIIGSSGQNYLYGVSNETTGVVTIVGNVSGGSGSNSHGVTNQSTGVVNIAGSIYSTETNSAATGVTNGVGTINILGNVYSKATYGVYNGTGTVNITGNVLAGSSYGGINNAAGSRTTVYGNISGSATSSSAYAFYNGTGGILILYGNAYGDISSGPLNGDTGSITIYGNAYGGNQGSSTHGAFNNGSGQYYISGNVYAGRTGPGAYNATGFMVISGSAFGSNTASSIYGVLNNTTGTVLISGSAVAGIYNASYGAFNNSTGILKVKRAVGNDWGLNSQGVYASVPGVFSNNVGSQTFVEELQCGARGQWPTGGNVYFTPNTKATSTFKNNTFQTTTLIESNSADSLFPPTSSVRQGTTYNLGLSTGTCNVPPVSSVIAGAAVDNTVGTTVLTPASTWNHALTSVTDTASMGGRLKNASTTSGTGSLLASFNL